MKDDNSKMKIISSLIKRECKENGITQKQICDKTRMSKQYVSSFFAGTAVVNTHFISTVISMWDCNLRFNLNENYLKRTQEFLADYLVEYCYKSDDYYLNSLKKVLTNEMKYSLAFPEYLALTAAFKYNKEEIQSAKKWIEETEKWHIKCLKDNPDAYLLFLMIKAEMEIDIDETKSALLTIQEAKEQASSSSSSSSSSSCLIGVLYLFEGICYSQLNDGLSALLSLQTAEKLLLETRNYRRTLAASKNIGSCLTQLYCFEKAEKQFEKVLKEAKRLNRDDMVDICNVSLINAYFQQGKYREVIERASLVSDNYKRKIHYIHLAWSYYFVKDQVNLEKTLAKMETFEKDEYYQMMIKLLYLYLNDSPLATKVDLLNQMIDERKDKNAEKLWCYKLLVAEYEKINDYQKVVEYQKRILKSLGYVSFADR